MAFKYYIDVDLSHQHTSPHHAHRLQRDIRLRVMEYGFLIYEVRPACPGDPKKDMECPIGKLVHLEERDSWLLFCHTPGHGWHAYLPMPEYESLEDALHVVYTDDAFRG